MQRQNTCGIIVTVINAIVSSEHINDRIGIYVLFSGLYTHGLQ